MLSSLLPILQNILNSAIPLVPVIVGIAIAIAGATLALGNHQRGKEGIMVALVGGAVMLAAPSIGSALASNTAPSAITAPAPTPHP